MIMTVYFKSIPYSDNVKLCVYRASVDIFSFSDALGCNAAKIGDLVYDKML